MKPLVAGNWKMHLTRAEAADLARELIRLLPAPLDHVDVALFPPFTCLAAVVEVVAGTDVTVGAQNLYPENAGAFTGEIAPPMLLDVGATRVLAGHSERRHVMGEDDALVNRKVRSALEHDILPVLCVGETLEEREAGRTAEVVDRQVRAGLEAVPAGGAGDVTLAYEPVWAIGTGLTAKPEQAAEVHARIRGLLVEIWGEAGRNVRILYGGSVKAPNARELMSMPEVNGVLVGGASLKADSFSRIARAAV
ncbi:MAG: triose-phosphate isomerase [Planctomycetota bacterium]|jgi:triosephosphate isomerase